MPGSLCLLSMSRSGSSDGFPLRHMRRLQIFLVFKGYGAPGLRRSTPCTSRSPWAGTLSSSAPMFLHILGAERLVDFLKSTYGVEPARIADGGFRLLSWSASGHAALRRRCWSMTTFTRISQRRICGRSWRNTNKTWKRTVKEHRQPHSADISEYKKVGGYLSLQKALGMEPQQIIDEVKKAGLAAAAPGSCSHEMDLCLCRSEVPKIPPL